MPGPTPSQPGWYPDQNGTMRWFDGASWTDHVQPGATGSTEPTVAGGTPLEPTRPLGERPAGPPGWQGGPQSAGQHATPPPSPPAGQPVAPYGAVPQPSFPSGPGPGGPGGPGFQSSGGRNRALLIVLAVVGAIVLIAVLGVGAWAVFLRDDESAGSEGRDDATDSTTSSATSDSGPESSLPATPPEQVVEDFFAAAEAGDCRAALTLLSRNFIADNDANCDDEEDFMEAGDFEAVVGEATIDEEADPPTASVPVTLTVEGFGEQELPFGMVVEDDEWKIDTIDEPGSDGPDPSFSAPTSVSIPTELLPSDFPSFPTDPSEIESYLSEFSEFLTITP